MGLTLQAAIAGTDTCIEASRMKSNRARNAVAALQSRKPQNSLDSGLTAIGGLYSPSILPSSQLINTQSTPELASAQLIWLPGNICQHPIAGPFPLFKAVSSRLAACMVDGTVSDFMLEQSLMPQK